MRQWLLRICDHFLNFGKFYFFEVLIVLLDFCFTLIRTKFSDHVGYKEFLATFESFSIFFKTQQLYLSVQEGLYGPS